MKSGVINDKIQEQINMLFTSIFDEQQKINSIKAPEEDKKHFTESMLKEFEGLRGRGFFFNYLSSGKGHGPFTELVDGSVKYDLITAIGVNLLGHSHPIYIKSVLESAAVDTIMCGNLLPHLEALELSKQIIESVKNTKLKNFWFAGSGSFANDTALKLIWQKKNPQYRIIAFEKAFAGRSVATQDITANDAYKEGMKQSIDVDHVPHFNQNDPENSLKNTIEALNKVVGEHPNSHCAIMIEIVQGEAGFIYGTKEYYEGIFSWAKDKGLYIWVDEVQTFGRTRELFAFQMYNLDKYVDVVTVGKALQCCGVLYSEELNPKLGLIAGTFNGNISSLKTGTKILKYLREGNFYGEDGKNHQIEKEFIGKLKDLAKKSCRDKITYVGGVGTMISFEVGDSSKEVTVKFIKELFNNGIISFMAGKDPVRVRFLVPTSITTKHIDEIINIVDKTAKSVL